MKKILLIHLFILSSFLVFGQTTDKIAGTSMESVNTIGSISVESISKVGNISSPGLFKSCKEIKDANPEAVDGIYTIDPDGEGGSEPFECYCDMTTDGGGWTLVLLSNTAIAGCPRPYWTEAVNNVNLNGALSTDITSYDLFLGVRHWNFLGSSARLDMGESPSNLAHRAYYDFSLDESNNYALVMSNESVTIHTEGTASPGMYTYHNGRPLTTRDADHDAFSSNCSHNYYESAWWYGACMSGSFWGGGLESFQDAPYWDGSGTEHFNYGSIWLR
ncbi:fibrinogen-like YCDxxxxGGGW domain-containing protein [Marinilabilia salmonicolor]|uniref:fibrinogen-like YCDxxxxGGGW domain-containing protein n=1 Tax=Marinilabilia salmonicolor TaxID=989 RepID=UPI00029B00B5|nr:fibrinogen-like YCDxxxxGGGW domain-containing protein [Marinilabilia salmonicolor]